MSQNDNLNNLLRNGAKNYLNMYSKVIPETKLTIKDLVEKAAEIEKKIISNKKNTEQIEVPITNRVSIKKEKKEHQNNSSLIINFDTFRTENPYIPKIRINRQKDKKEIIIRESRRSSISSLQGNIPTFQGIMSIYPTQDFFPIENYDDNNNNDSINSNSFLKKKNTDHKSKKPHNNIDYEYKINPLFFTNRYIEYIYEDKGDKLYEESDLIRNLFEKKVKNDSIDELYIAKQDSPYLEIYTKLLQKEKEELEDENKENYINDNNGNEEGPLTREEIEKIRNTLENKNNDIEFNFRNNFIQLMAEFYNVKNNNNDNFNQNLNNNPIQINDLKFEQNPNEISFQINIQGEITKTIKNNPKKQHSRGMIIRGPIATWYKMNNDNEFVKEKGHFDIRNIEFKKDDKNKDNKKNEEEFFQVTKVIENGKEKTKPIVFSSFKIVEFGNKTFSYIFSQLQDYFREFYSNLEKSTYSVLKFISDSNCKTLILESEQNKRLLYYIYWHPKLINLSIPSSFVADLGIVMNNNNWECQLRTLCIKKDAGTCEDNIGNIFKNVNSISIQNIHFIDMPFNKKFIDALIDHIDLFYNCTTNSNNINSNTNMNINNNFNNSLHNSTMNLNNNLNEDNENNENEDDNNKNNEKNNINLNKKNSYSKYRDFSIPIKNLSWKRDSNSNESSSKTEDALSLKGLYYVFMHMLIKGLKYNNNTLPEVFELLDLSESIVTDDIGYLVKIITKFKLIKEINLSNTRILGGGKVIESSNFLSKIKLTDKIDEIIDEYEIQTKENELEREIEKYKDTQADGKIDNNIFNYQNQDLNYDFSHGIFPILEKIYLYNTDLKEDISKDVYGLFKRLKFFQGFYYSTQTINNSQENNSLNIKLCEKMIDEIQKDKKSYCENIFQLSND